MRRKWKNLEKRLRNWYLRDSISEFMSLKRKQVRGC